MKILVNNFNILNEIFNSFFTFLNSLQHHGQKVILKSVSYMFGLAIRHGSSYLKREPRHLLLTDTGAGTARLTPPCTVADSRRFFTTPTHCDWAGVNCYMALCAANRTKATAISRIETIRMAETLLFRLRRAERMDRGQPCEKRYSATHCRRKARRRKSSGFVVSAKTQSGGSFLPPQGFAKR